MRLPLLAAAALLLLASACRPLYLPPVPEAAEPPARPVLDVELTVQDGRPLLLLEVVSVPERGYLGLQWFAPDNREAASESIWLDAESEGTGREVPLPADVDAKEGTWRLLLSLHSRVLRQLDVTVP